MSKTLFAYFKGTLSNGDDNAPEDSAVFNYPAISAKHNVIGSKGETIELDDGETRTITYPGKASTDWVCIMARVVGHAFLAVVGEDYAGAPTVSRTDGYGTEAYPGMISIVTTNITDMEFEAVTDSTKIQYIVYKLTEDDNL
jgi:hypothetical protein